MGDHVEQGAAQRGPELAVGPVEAGRAAERRDQQVGGRPGRRDASHHEGQAGPDLRTPPGQQQVPAEARHEQPHVLLDQQQRHGGEDALPALPGVEALYHHRGEHGDEGDLVEVEDDRLHDRKRQGVGHADEIRGPRSELAPCVGPQRRDGQGEQHALGDQQGGRAVVDPVQRGEQRQRRRPVVGQQHEVRALPVGDAAGDRDRRPQVRVAADPLIEDDQVEGAGQEAAEEVQRVQAVDEGGRDGEHADLDAGAAPQRPQPTGADGRPAGRAGGGRRPGTSGLATHR